MAPWGLCVLTAGLCWFTLGGGRRYLGLAIMFLGLLLLAATTLAFANIHGPGPGSFVLGVVASVCLGWLGYRVQRTTPS